MSNCMTLIGYPASGADVANWEVVANFQHAIQTLPLKNLCILDGEYQADPLYFDYIDCDQIVCIVFHECTGEPEADEIIGTLDSVNASTFILEDGKLCYRLLGWCVPTGGCDQEVDEPPITLPDICVDPCERKEILEGLLLQLIAGKQLVNGSYGGRYFSFAKGDKACLERWHREAERECNKRRCIRNPPRHYRWNCFR